MDAQCRVPRARAVPVAVSSSGGGEDPGREPRERGEVAAVAVVVVVEAVVEDMARRVTGAAPPPACAGTTMGIMMMGLAAESRARVLQVAQEVSGISRVVLGAAPLRTKIASFSLRRLWGRRSRDAGMRRRTCCTIPSEGIA